MTASHTPLRTTVPPARRWLRRGPLLLLATAVFACDDAASDPFADYGGEEAQAALMLGVRLADPTVWAEEDGLSVEESVALESWHESWEMGDDAGAAIREGTYPTLARSFVAGRTDAEVGVEIGVLSDAVARALLVGGRTLPDPLAGGLRAASGHMAEASTAQGAGDLQAAAEHLLRGSDALRTISPEDVARAMVSEVDERFRRVEPSDPYTEQELERTERLVRGGRQALEARDWVLAIRRAYYARALLDGNG